MASNTLHFESSLFLTRNVLFFFVLLLLFIYLFCFIANAPPSFEHLGNISRRVDSSEIRAGFEAHMCPGMQVCGEGEII